MRFYNRQHRHYCESIAPLLRGGCSRRRTSIPPRCGRRATYSADGCTWCACTGSSWRIRRTPGRSTTCLVQRAVDRNRL